MVCHQLGGLWPAPPGAAALPGVFTARSGFTPVPQSAAAAAGALAAPAPALTRRHVRTTAGTPGPAAGGRPPAPGAAHPGSRLCRRSCPGARRWVIRVGSKRGPLQHPLVPGAVPAGVVCLSLPPRAATDAGGAAFSSWHLAGPRGPSRSPVPVGRWPCAGAGDRSGGDRGQALGGTPGPTGRMQCGAPGGSMPPPGLAPAHPHHGLPTLPAQAQPVSAAVGREPGRCQNPGVAPATAWLRPPLGVAPATLRLSDAGGRQPQGCSREVPPCQGTAAPARGSRGLAPSRRRSG